MAIATAELCERYEQLYPGAVTDVIVGDVDGVVCVPSEICEEVLLSAEETVDTENAVRDGMDPVEAYDEFDEF